MQDLSRLLDDVYGSGDPGGEVEPGKTPAPPEPPATAGVEDDDADLDGLLGLGNPNDTPPRGQARILDLDADLDADGSEDRTAAVPALDHDADDHSHTEAVPVLHLDDDLDDHRTAAVASLGSDPTGHGRTEAVPVLDLDDDLPDRESRAAAATVDNTHDDGDDTHRGWVREDDDILPRARRSRWRLPRR